MILIVTRLTIATSYWYKNKLEKNYPDPGYSSSDLLFHIQSSPIGIMSILLCDVTIISDSAHTEA